MAVPVRWRDFYNSAFRECASWPSRVLLADTAITLCVQRLLEIPQKRTSERERIYVALDDLKILKALCRKYR
jgi:hypothetical protein